MNEYTKTIMHIDMDAFFASVEQLDNPKLRGKPVIVGGATRGVVAAASYEARAFGVRSAMPIFEAKARCPQGFFVNGNRTRYLEISAIVKNCLEGFSPLVEMASIDEAYLDIVGLEKLFGTKEEIGYRIKHEVKARTGGLNCSVGIAPLKFLAKIASEEKKPNGFFIIEPHEVEDFLLALNVGKIPGVGKKFLEKLHKLGIKVGADVLRLSETFWVEHFGKQGLYLYERARGLDSQEISPMREAKSESAEVTLNQDTLDMEVLRSWLLRHAERIGNSLRRHGLAGRVITLKIKFNDFKQITRQKSLPTRTNSTDTIFQVACSLLKDLELSKRVRLIGLGVSAFENDQTVQLSFLNKPNQISLQEEKRKDLDKNIDILQERYGKDIVMRGRVLDEKKAVQDGDTSNESNTTLKERKNTTQKK